MIVRFGSWTFDARKRLVVRDDGGVVHLTPKAFDLLGVLLERAPDVVRKTDLHELLWPGTFVSEATLVGLIKELRRAFGDRDKAAPVIRTSYGIGYAFVNPVQRADATFPRPPSSIAVLPFADIGDDPQNAYFSDGLAEELTTALAKLPGLRVAARSSAFHFRDHPTDLKQIGMALNIDHVVEGSVRQSGGRLRVTVRLVKVDDGYCLWSARYERETGDLFAVHDEITASIVGALAVALGGHVPLAQRHSQNLEAFELYLRGRHCWHQRTPESVHTAVAHFEAAVQLDRDYALAYAGLACAYSALAFYGYLPVADARSAAQRSAARALALAPHLADSHYAMALFHLWLSPDWPDAEPSFVRALTIAPDFAPAHTHFAALLGALGRVKEARTHADQAMALDPLSPAVFGTVALCLFTSGQLKEARRCGERALELQSNFVVGLYALGMTYCRIDEFEKACAAFDRLLALSNRASYFLGWAALGRGLAGNEVEARALSTELENGHPSEYVHPVSRMLAAIGLGNRTAALRALESCVTPDGPSFQLAHASPFLGKWASEEPFAKLLDRLHVSRPHDP